MELLFFIDLILNFKITEPISTPINSISSSGIPEFILNSNITLDVKLLYESVPSAPNSSIVISYVKDKS